MSLKDYYKILGVPPNADLASISRAYKTLCLKYHPDRWKGDLKIAHERMVEINEAYSILSDPIKRKEYDDTVGNFVYEEDSAEEEELLSELEKDWMEVVKYFPDLTDLATELRKISFSLEYCFKVRIIQEKMFRERHNLARSFKADFLKLYFGSNPEIVLFAEHLINSGNKPACRALNRTVSLLGDSVGAESIILKVCQEFHIYYRSSISGERFNENPAAKAYREETERAEREKRDAEDRKFLDKNRKDAYAVMALMVTFFIVSVLAVSMTSRKSPVSNSPRPEPQAIAQPTISKDQPPMSPAPSYFGWLDHKWVALEGGSTYKFFKSIYYAPDSLKEIHFKAHDIREVIMSADLQKFDSIELRGTNALGVRLPIRSAAFRVWFDCVNHAGSILEIDYFNSSRLDPKVVVLNEGFELERLANNTSAVVPAGKAIFTDDAIEEVCR